MSNFKCAPDTLEEIWARLLAELSPHTQTSPFGFVGESFAQQLSRAKSLTDPAILRLPTVLRKRGDRGRSSHYQDIKQGLFTPPVAIGARAVGWPDYEVAILNVARIAGATDEEIRALVTKLIEARKTKIWEEHRD